MKYKREKSLFILFLFFLSFLLLLNFVYSNDEETKIKASTLRLIHESKLNVMNGDLKKGLEFAEKAVKADPAYAPAWKQLGRILMIEGKYSEALNCFQTVLSLDPNEPEVQGWILTSIEQLIINEDYSEADKILGKWGKEEKSKEANYAISAMRNIIYGKLMDAESDLNAIETNPEELDESTKSLFALAWTQLGLHYLKNRNNKKALECFLKGKEFRNKWSPLLRELGWTYFRENEYEKAVEEWKALLENSPTNRKVLEWIISALIRGGNLDEALLYSERLLKLNPTNEKALSLRLMIFRLMEDEKNSTALENKIKKLKNGKRVILLSKAYVENFKKASEYLEQLYKMNPKDKKVKRMLENAYLDWSSNVSSKDALIPLKKLITISPNKSSAWRDLGWSLWMNGKKEEAIKAWDRAIMGGHLADKDKLIFLIIAQLAEDGRLEQAVDLYKRWTSKSEFLPLGLKLVNNTRYRGAKEILKIAWENKENLPITGLYLSFAEANSDVCEPVPIHLKPFLENLNEKTSKDKLKVFISSLDLCSYNRELSKILLNKKVQRIIKNYPELDKKLTDIIIALAVEMRNRDNLEFALYLLKKAIQRAPNKPDIWAIAVNTAEKLNKRREAQEIMRYVLKNTSNESIKEGILAKLALDKGKLQLAVKHFYKSLKAQPEQPDLRVDLFNTLLKLDKYKEAREQIKWFEGKLTTEDITTKSMLADMYYMIGEKEKAFALWQELYLSYPDTPVYAIGAASSLYEECQPEDAIDILKQLLSTKSDADAYELLGDIYISLNRFNDALKLAQEAIQKNVKAGIYRIQAEVAELLKDFELAENAAKEYLKMDSSNVSMLRILGESLVFKRKYKKAEKFYKKLLKRNSQFLIALTSLKDLVSIRNRPYDALKYAKTIVKQRPWDFMANLRLAVAQAEADKYRKAYKFLREHAKRNINEAVPILIYKDLSMCNYFGKFSVKNAISHLRALKTAGYHFITPAELTTTSKEKRVIIVILNPNYKVLKNLDRALKEIGGRAVLALNTDSPLLQNPEILKSGRWMLASSGPINFHKMPIDEKGTLGNPFTHKLFINGKKEDKVSMYLRINSKLKRASKALGDTYKHILIYPWGDYGQISLDTDDETIETLHQAVKENFDFAIAYDSSGFVCFESEKIDFSRLPGKVVPIVWKAGDLLKYLKEENPLVRARLELAKILYWQSQHERANIRFKEAKKAGANPVELNFNWGSNYDMEGDLPDALEKLRLALKIYPRSKDYKKSPGYKRIEKALKRALNRKHLFIEPYYDTWEDSDGRSFWGYGGEARVYFSDSFQITAFANRNHWERQGYGFEEGTRYGGNVKYHFSEERWLNLKLWYLDMDNIDDHIGGIFNIHIPNARWGGHIDLEAAHEEIETVEAIREYIMSNRFAIYTYSRIQDMWDLFANVTYRHNTDTNDIILINGRFYRRFKEWPFFGIGYLFRFGDSDFDPPQYYAPQRLQQHQLYGTSRGEFSLFHYSITAQAGYARERDTEWKFVWGLRAELDIRILPILILHGAYIRQESPRYRMKEYRFGLTFRFF